MQKNSKKYEQQIKNHAKTQVSEANTAKITLNE